MREHKISGLKKLGEMVSQAVVEIIMNLCVL
jgi:hypothetical protein